MPGAWVFQEGLQGVNVDIICSNIFKPLINFKTFHKHLSTDGELLFVTQFLTSLGEADRIYTSLNSSAKAWISK